MQVGHISESWLYTQRVFIFVHTVDHWVLCFADSYTIQQLAVNCSAV